jgi:WD40 repeat protein
LRFKNNLLLETNLESSQTLKQSQKTRIFMALLELDNTNNYEYKVGGSLPPKALCYVNRSADRQILSALESGEFCYVFNCRQMGKSSLKARTIQILEEKGFACAAVDVTKLGTKQVNADRWYKGLVVELARVFNLSRGFDLKGWRSELSELSALQQLSLFIEDVLLTRIPHRKICIFLEEIDNVKSLDFSTDDLFALIRACYEQRLSNPEYDRLTFCLLGVATPSDLISDKLRTPFNIGKSIDLTGFSLEESRSALTPGLASKVDDSERVLAEILHWTGGQPFLTQKLCDLVVKNAVDRSIDVDAMVRENIIDNWEVSDTPPHLKTIRDRLKGNGQKQVRLLAIYQSILVRGGIEANDNWEHMELLLSGLVVKQQGKLVVTNQIYQLVFNLRWVERELIYLRPDFYSVALAGWLAADRLEESWLLRGEVLNAAQKWAADKSLSDEDYRFLDASRELEQREIQRQLNVEAESTRILASANQLLIDANEVLERANLKAKRQIKIGGGILAISLIGAVFAATWASIIGTEARLERINSLTMTANAAFNGDRHIEALSTAIKAGEQLKLMANSADDRTRQSVRSILQRSMAEIREQNHFFGHDGKIRRVKFDPTGKYFASIGEDGNIAIWDLNGKEVRRFGRPQQAFRSLVFSPNGKTIAAIDIRNNVSLWSLEGQEISVIPGRGKSDSFISDICFINNGNNLVYPVNEKEVSIADLTGKTVATLSGNNDQVWSVFCSDKHNIILTGDRSGMVKIWDLNGREIKTILASKQAIFGLALHPDGKTIGVASGDREISVWDLSGKEIKRISGHTNNPLSINFSPDGKTFLTTSYDRTLKIWDTNTGRQLLSLNGDDAELFTAAFSNDGKIVATAGGSGKIKLWNLTDRTYKLGIGHTDSLRSVDLPTNNPNLLATAGSDRQIILWDIHGNKIDTISADSKEPWNRIEALKFSPDGKTIAAASTDGTLSLWSISGRSYKKISPQSSHSQAVLDVSFHPDGKTLASVSFDGTIRLWTIDGKFLHQIDTKGGKILSVAFSNDGKTIVSGHEDGSIKIWDVSGNLLFSKTRHRQAVTSINFSPDGKIIASASRDMMINLWHRETDRILTLKGHTGEVAKIHFHPDGKTLVSASTDNTLRIWNVSTGEEIRTLRGLGYPFWNVRFSTDGKTLASVNDNGLVQIWNTENPDLDRLTERGCQWLKNYLSHSNSRSICN